MTNDQAWVDPRPPTLGVDIGGVLVDDLLYLGVDADPLPGAAEGLEELARDFDGRVHLISKAGPKVRAVVRQWLTRTGLLEEANLGLERVHFVDRDQDKAAIYRQHGVSHMVDDGLAVHRTLDDVPFRFLLGAEPQRDAGVGDPLRGVLAVTNWRRLVPLVTRTVRQQPPDDLPQRLEVRPMSAPEARRWSLSWHPAAVISVVDEPDDAVDTDLEQLVVCCRDTLDPDEGMVAAQVHQILEFVRMLADGDRLVVHCRGGIGRSPAVALGILAATGMAPLAAAREISDVRPAATPNPHMIQLFDQELSSEGHLVSAVAEAFPAWKPAGTTR